MNADSVKLQAGHAASDTQERDYLDLVDARIFSAAVYAVLIGDQALTRSASRWVPRGKG